MPDEIKDNNDNNETEMEEEEGEDQKWEESRRRKTRRIHEGVDSKNNSRLFLSLCDID